MTGGDDDIAAALPRAPYPSPARREAAIAEAMRRFDGGEGRSAEGLAATRPAPWRTRFNRPQAGALAGAFLVALIALPLAWSSLPDPIRDRGRDGKAQSSAAAVGRGPPAHAGPPAADSSPPRPDSDSAFPIPSGEPGSPPPAAGSPPRSARAQAEPAADALEFPPLFEAPPAAEVYEPVPPAPAPAPADVAPEASAGGDITVTGSRIRRPNLESTVPITSVGGEEFVATGASARRGDWNACTIDDPKRDLSACRRDVATVARGASGKAAPHLAQGLSRAWEGDRGAAIAAFDRAIELAPRSSAAYLNRGLARRSLGDVERAIADLDRAIAYAPEAARGYYHRSLLLRQRGDGRRARADEARAIELDPRYAAVVRAARRQAR